MVNLLLSPEKDLARSHVVKTTTTPPAVSGGMFVCRREIHSRLNADAQPKLFGRDWNDEACAFCKSDMLIKGEDAEKHHTSRSLYPGRFDARAKCEVDF
jgi:type I restriction enzyme M protein